MTKDLISLTLRIPQDIHDRLQKEADKERRSMTQQIVWLIEKWLDGSRK